jgi:hypothetical protein
MKRKRLLVIVLKLGPARQVDLGLELGRVEEKNRGRKNPL